MIKIYTPICLSILLSIVSISNIIAQDDEGKKKKSFVDEPDLKGTVIFDFGFNSLVDVPRVMSTKVIQSRSAGLYYQRQFPMGKKMSFNPALGITMDKYSFDENVALDYVDNGTGSLVLDFDTLSAGIDLKKSALSTSYLEAPVEFRYYLKGNESNDGFYFAFGGFAGIRLESHTKVKFEEDGVKKLVKKRDDFQQKSLRYGLLGRIGIKGINFFYKQSLSSIFNDQGPTDTIDTSYRTIGISIKGL